ncbi:MAG: tetratricopeptide repeat protein [Nitrospira sp. CG24A]|nr:MAG: tetratricopeptide repeat protein [Nitrospira sp. CG24A]
MYESFYGFRTNPFSLIPDPRFLFLGTQHKTALNLLEYGLFNRAIFTVITGEPGTGKTTLLNAILEQSQHEVSLGVLSHTHAGLGSLMPWVLMAFGLDGKGMDSVELFKTFAAFISREHERQRRVVLVVDEAQNLGAAMLEELRLLSNVNDGRRQPFQIILSGQPALRGLLQRGELIQFAQRISVDYHLKPFGEEEVPAYIAHRLAMAGGAGRIFTDQACLVVHRLTSGNARLVNQVCDVSLAYGYAEQSPWVTAGIVWRAANDRRAGGILPIAPGPLTDMLTAEEAAAEQHRLAVMPPTERSAGLNNKTKTPAAVSKGLGASYENGLAFKQAGSYKQAIESFEQAAADATQEVRATSQVALCLYAMGRHEEAARSLTMLLEGRQGTELELRDIRYFLGRVLESLGKPREALAHYRIIHSQKSEFRDVTSRLSRLSSAQPFFSFPPLFEPRAWIKGIVRNCL